VSSAGKGAHSARFLERSLGRYGNELWDGLAVYREGAKIPSFLPEGFSTAGLPKNIKGV